jgi:hypothetical protein
LQTTGLDGEFGELERLRGKVVEQRRTIEALERTV